MLIDFLPLVKYPLVEQLFVLLQSLLNQMVLYGFVFLPLIRQILRNLIDFWGEARKFPFSLCVHLLLRLQEEGFLEQLFGDVVVEKVVNEPLQGFPVLRMSLSLILCFHQFLVLPLDLAVVELIVQLADIDFPSLLEQLYLLGLILTHYGLLLYHSIFGWFFANILDAFPGRFGQNFPLRLLLHLPQSSLIELIVDVLLRGTLFLLLRAQ